MIGRRESSLWWAFSSLFPKPENNNYEIADDPFQAVLFLHLLLYVNGMP